MYVDSALNSPGKIPQIAPPIIASKQADVTWELELDCADERERGANGVLSGRANVEQAGFKGKRHGKTGHDQRRRLIKHLGELSEDRNPAEIRDLKPVIATAD